jgi:hypothetical protein
LVAVDVGPPSYRRDCLVIPMQWCALRAATLFSRFEGDLEVAPLGERTTQITLMGSYEPQLAIVGASVDRLVRHRIVEASVRSFLTRIAVVLDAAAA